MDVDEEELARQITLLEFDIFARIKVRKIFLCRFIISVTLFRFESFLYPPQGLTLFVSQSSELLGQSWNKPKTKHKSPNVLQMIARFNHLSLWVGTQIVLQEKIKPRAKVLAKLIAVADARTQIPAAPSSHSKSLFVQHLRKMNNYNSLMAFVAMFNNSAIFRLKHTLAELPQKYQDVHKQAQPSLLLVTHRLF